MLIFFYRYLYLGLVILTLAWIGKTVVQKVRPDRSLLTAGLILLVTMVAASWMIFTRQCFGLVKLSIFLLPIGYFLATSSTTVSERLIRWFPFAFFALFAGKCCYQLMYYHLPHTADHRLKYFGNPIVYGQMAAMACILALFCIRHEKSIIKNAFYIIALLVGLIVLFFTYARGAWLGFVAAVIWFLGSNVKNRFVLILSALLIIFGIGVLIAEPALLDRITSIFSLTETTNAQRLVIWKTAVKIFTSSPLYGIGFHMFPRYFGRFSHDPLIPMANHAHNNLLQIMAEFGLAGLMAWLLVAIALVIRIRKAVSSIADPFRHCLAQTAIAWFISLLVHGLTDYTLAMTAPMTLFMMVLGLLAALDNTPVSTTAEPPTMPVRLQSNLTANG